VITNFRDTYLNASSLTNLNYQNKCIYNKYGIELSVNSQLVGTNCNPSGLVPLSSHQIPVIQTVEMIVILIAMYVLLEYFNQCCVYITVCIRGASNFHTI